jgi:hypothetical protein
MKRLIVSAPSDITLDALTPEQQAALQSVIAQWVQPMPGTIEHNGTILIDCVMQDNFDPLAIGELELPFEVVGYWQWDGVDELTALMPLDTAVLANHLPDVIEYDEDGNVIGEHPAELHIPHDWGGWPEPETEVAL